MGDGDDLGGSASVHLQGNPVHHSLAEAVNGVTPFEAGKFGRAATDALTDADSCLSCHGTKVEVQGLKPRATAMGEMTPPQREQILAVLVPAINAGELTVEVEGVPF